MPKYVSPENEEDKLLDELAALDESSPEFEAKYKAYENAQRAQVQAAISKYGTGTIERLKSELSHITRLNMWLLDSLLPDGRVPQHVVEYIFEHYPDFEEHLAHLVESGDTEVFHEYVQAFAIWSTTSLRVGIDREAWNAASYLMWHDKDHVLFMQWYTKADRNRYGEKNLLIPPFEEWVAEFEAWKKRCKVNLPPSPGFLASPEAVNMHIPDVFRNGSAFVPDNPATTTVIAAIYAGGPRARNLLGGWKTSPTGGPIFERLLRNGGRILAYPGIETRPDASLPTAESLWSFVERLGPFTADVALAVLAQMVEPSNGKRPQYPLLEPVPITAEAILRYKGIQRYGMERRILELRIAEAMDQLQALRFDVEQLRANDPAANKPIKGGASWRGDRLFDIVKVTKWQEDLFGERKQIGVGWTVRAGQWAYYWFNAQGRVWLARMSKALLELDHRENRPAAVLAKKIGWYLSTVASRSRTFYIQIRKLLEDIGELPVPEARDKHWAGRTRDRFDEAMLTLREAGVLQTVEWPDGYGPEDTDRSKGWVQRWLDAHVSGTLPEAAPELPRRQAVHALPARRRRRHKEAAPEQTQIDGLAIRKARIERKWSQEELARHLGISRSYLAKLETGRRLPSQDLARKLKAWLAEQRGYHAL